jgi:predicted site-specific integrase-resolvase
MTELTFSRAGRIHSRHMEQKPGHEPTAAQSQNSAPSAVVVKAALYARVSTDKQREEATIENRKPAVRVEAANRGAIFQGMQW